MPRLEQNQYHGRPSPFVFRGDAWIVQLRRISGRANPDDLYQRCQSFTSKPKVVHFVLARTRGRKGEEETDTHASAKIDFFASGGCLGE